MVEPEEGSFVAECFWPGIGEADLAALERRIQRVIAESVTGRAVRYLGSILLRQDEVVLCQLEGPADAVREVAVRAEIPFERILATAYSPWPLLRNGGSE